MAKKAFEQPFKNITGIPAVDLTEKRYCGVKFNANGDIVLAVAGDSICGVLQEPNDVGQPARIMNAGISFAIFGDVVASGADLSMKADGTFIPAIKATVTDKATVDHLMSVSTVVATAVVGGASGDIGCVLLK